MVSSSEAFPEIKPKALVIARPDDFASAVLASAVLRPAREALPQTRIFLLIHAKYAPLYVEHPALDGIFTVSDDSTPEELAAHFKKQKIDAVVHLAFSQKVADAAKLAGVAFSVAEEGEHDGSVSLEILRPKTRRGGKHPAFRNFDILRPFGIVVPEHPEIELSVHRDAHKEIFGEIGKQYGLADQSDYAVFSLDQNRCGHQINASVFSKTAEWLTRFAKIPILVLGDPVHSENFLRFSRNSHGAHVIDLRGKTSPAEDAWLIDNARICFSGENAYAYLAVAMECPLIALFVDFSGDRWFPLGHLATNIFTGAHRLPFEPAFLYNYRASRSFKIEKIASALRFSLALSNEDVRETRIKSSEL